MKDAVKQAKDGVVIDFDVSPGSKRTLLHGYNPWRKRIEIKLSERAEKGRANEQLISFLSELFNVNSGDVKIIAGLTGGKKSVKITGMNASDILNVLARNEPRNS